MRVGYLSFSQGLMPDLAQLASEQVRLQSQAASGQRVRVASDDPASMRHILDDQAEMVTLKQRQENVGRLTSRLNVAFQGVNQLRGIVDRANEIAKSVTGVQPQSSLDAFALEVDQLVEQAVQVGNSKDDGVYLFSGTAGDAPPIEVTRGADGLVTGYRYAGSEKVAVAEISEGVDLGVVPPGVNTSGTGPRGLLGDARSGSDVIAHLISLRDALKAGRRSEVNSVLSPALDRDADNVVLQIAVAGATQARLQATADSLDASINERVQSISTERDIDLAQILVRLNEVQAAYSAALQTGGKILRQSLLDYV